MRNKVSARWLVAAARGCALLLVAWLALSAAAGLAMPERRAIASGPTPLGQGGGGYQLKDQDALTPEQYRAIQAQIARNQRLLYEQGKLRAPQAQPTVSLAWPLRLADSVSDYGYHGVSNFVDHDPAYPNHVLDYNSGTRTYDLASGYNHQGTDIFLWPFSWQKMDAGAVEIVAAADGVIVYKQDGNFDRSCSMGNSDWNAVYVQHDDGSVAWYGHMRKNSLTAKPVGSAVVAGEYLGLVGSSGSSTGPHLHFELYDSSANLIDPYAGPSNPTVSQSLWSDQRPYYDSAVNHVGTGDAAPDFPACPADEVPHERAAFDPGSTIYFVTYYRDQLAGQVSQYRLYRPDNSLYASWTGSSSVAHYAASYWYWFFSIPAEEPLGDWRFEVTYQGTTYQHIFHIGPTIVPRLYLPTVVRPA